MEFVTDFNDKHFAVDILLGADAAYRFLGPIDERFKYSFVQQSKSGSIVFVPLPKAIPALSQKADSKEVHMSPESATQYHKGFEANSKNQESSTSSLSTEKS